MACFAGAIAGLLARMPWIQAGAEFVTMPAPQPMAGTSPFTMWLALYGERFGFLVFGVGLLFMILSANAAPTGDRRRQP